MNMEEFYAKLAEEERQAELERKAEAKRRAEEASKREAEAKADINKEKISMMKYAVAYEEADIQKFKIRDSEPDWNDDNNWANREAIFCGYDFTDKIEELADIGVYFDAMKCLETEDDSDTVWENGFLHPEDRARLKKQCAELYPYMDKPLKDYESHLDDIDAHSTAEDLREKYNEFKQILETDKADTRSETRDVAEEKADKTTTLQEANVAKTDESDGSDRLAAVRKALAKHVDDTLETHLEERKIPEKAKKIERKVSNVIFKSRGGNGE